MPGVLFTLLGRGHPVGPLGSSDTPSQILHRVDPIPPVPGVRNTAPPLEGLNLLSNEVEYLLWKGAIGLTPLYQVRSGYYSTYFLVPQKDGCHRPILNLKFFNLNVCKTSFKMETLQSIIAVMHPHQWMSSMYLPTSTFKWSQHTSSSFLTFSWQGTSYQFRILLFGLSSASWSIFQTETFTV